MKMKSNFEIVEVADEYLAVPVGEEAEFFHGIVAMSEAAAFLLNKMRQNRTEEELVTLLMDEYDTERWIADKDVNNMITTLLQIGLIEE